jgi:hypothetical protein
VGRTWNIKYWNINYIVGFRGQCSTRRYSRKDALCHGFYMRRGTADALLILIRTVEPDAAWRPFLQGPMALRVQV